ncbi:hypothetical protein J6590_074185 [Homalodisca vitripennis]|nr:hypothetical protein J6590_074185 [Homalodisca vitripennis]
MVSSFRCLEEEMKSLKSSNSDSKSSQQKMVSTLLLNNRFEPLSDPENDYGDCKTVTGDSHARGLVAYVQKAISSKTNVTGLCKPGAGLLEVAPTSAPPAEHCYVLLAGTNYLATGSQHIIFKHMETVLENCSKHFKVLISPLLPRHDMPSSSPIHDTVAFVNNCIQELCDRHGETGMTHRRHFTSHGLHLTDSGKRLLDEYTTTSTSISQACRSDLIIEPIPVHPKTLPHESYAVNATGLQRISPVQQTNSINTDSKPVF